MTSRARILVGLMIVALSGQAAFSAEPARRADLVGVWETIDSTLPGKAECPFIRITFRSDGTADSTDGQLEEKKTWTAAPIRSGLLIHFTYLSNNGHANCQGIPADVVRDHTVLATYAEFEDKKQALRLFFGSAPTRNFLLFRRTAETAPGLQRAHTTPGPATAVPATTG